MTTWDFSGGTLPAGATVLRGTQGYYFNSSGTYALAAQDTARFSYDPATSTLKGLLLEDIISIENYPPGITGGQNASITTGVASPDGGTGAVTVTEDNTTNVHDGFDVINSIPSDNGAGIFTMSCWLKAGTRQYVVVQIWSNIPSVNAVTINVDTINWTVVGASVGAYSIIGSPTVENAGGGWHRVAAKFSSSVATSPAMYVCGATGSSDTVFPSYTGSSLTWTVWAPEIRIGNAVETNAPFDPNTGVCDRWDDRLTITIPSGTKQISVVHDDSSQTILTAAPGHFAIAPSDLKRPWVSRITTIPGVASQVGLNFHGDSITAGNACVYPFTRRVRDAVALAGTSAVLNQRGIVGQSWNFSWVYGPTLISDAAAEIDAAIYFGQRNYLILFAGTNGLVLQGNSAATEYANFQTYITARQTAGWKDIIVCTMLPRQSFSETIRGAYNSLLVSGAATYGYRLARFDLDPNIGAAGQQNNSNYFWDQIHPTDAGHAIMASIVFNAIKDSLPQTTLTSKYGKYFSRRDYAEWLARIVGENEESRREYELFVSEAERERNLTAIQRATRDHENAATEFGASEVALFNNVTTTNHIKYSEAKEKLERARKERDHHYYMDIVNKEWAKYNESKAKRH